MFIAITTSWLKRRKSSHVTRFHKVTGFFFLCARQVTTTFHYRGHSFKVRKKQKQKNKQTMNQNN